MEYRLIKFMLVSFRTLHKSQTRQGQPLSSCSRISPADRPMPSVVETGSNRNSRDRRWLQDPRGHFGRCKFRARLFSRCPHTARKRSGRSAGARQHEWQQGRDNNLEEDNISCIVVSTIDHNCPRRSLGGHHFPSAMEAHRHHQLEGSEEGVHPSSLLFPN